MSDLVIINWVDSARPISEWQYLSDYEPMGVVACVSVGFLIHDGDKVKSLAPNMGGIDDSKTVQASGIIHIPACSITNICKLEEVK